MLRGALACRSARALRPELVPRGPLRRAAPKRAPSSRTPSASASSEPGDPTPGPSSPVPDPGPGPASKSASGPGQRAGPASSAPEPILGPGAKAGPGPGSAGPSSSPAPALSSVPSTSQPRAKRTPAAEQSTGVARGPADGYDARQEAAFGTRSYQTTSAAERARHNEWLLDWVEVHGTRAWHAAVPAFVAQFPTAASLGSKPNERLCHVYNDRAKKHGHRSRGRRAAPNMPAVPPLDWRIVSDTVYDADGVPRGPAGAYDAKLEAACRTRGFHFTPAPERTRQDEWLLDWVEDRGTLAWNAAVPEFMAQFPTAWLGSRRPGNRLAHMYHKRAKKHGRQPKQELTTLGYPPVLPPGWYLEDGKVFDAGGAARVPAEARDAIEEVMAADARKAHGQTPQIVERARLGLPPLIPSGWDVKDGNVYDSDGTLRTPAEAWEARGEASCRGRGFRFTPAEERAQQDDWLVAWARNRGTRNWKAAVPEFLAQFPAAQLGETPNGTLSKMYGSCSKKQAKLAAAAQGSDLAVGARS